jgi:sugar phosphate isomerase/epimerase
MKFGFRSDAKLEELEIARRLGIPVIELHWLPQTRADEAAIRERLAAFEVGVSALLTGEERNLDELRQDLEATQRFGARAFVTHPHPLPLNDSPEHQRFVEVFAPAAEYAAQLGVRLAVHSCGLNPEQWDLMFRLVPALALKYDPSFSLEAGRSYRAEIAKYAQRIVHVHIKDERLMGRETDFSNGFLRYEYSPAGTGDINWGSVIALLYEAGYTGDLALETHSPFWWDHLEWDLILSKRHIEQFLL